MSAPSIDPADPPPYSESAATPNDADTLLQPTILILAGQSIHAESASAAPLYTLSNDIAHFVHATSEVELSRIERSVRTSAATGEPAVRPRSRHIYTLRQLRALGRLLARDIPAFYAKAVSRHAGAGDVGLKRNIFHTRLVALPIVYSGTSKAESSRKIKAGHASWPQFVEASGSPQLYEIARKDGRYAWHDGKGAPVAVEDEGDDQHRLVVSVSLRREAMDALVALWCCRLWMDAADRAESVHEGMDGVRRRMKQGRGLLGGKGGFM